VAVSNAAASRGTANVPAVVLGEVRSTRCAFLLGSRCLTAGVAGVYSDMGARRSEADVLNVERPRLQLGAFTFRGGEVRLTVASLPLHTVRR
jgi:hypothetical protein